MKAKSSMTRFVQRPLCGAALPHRLAELPIPPKEVWLAGALPRIASVGVVGTRHPTVEAEAFAHSLARDLSWQGALVVSGGASGIDSAAHRGALAAGGPSLVVAPAGLEHPYPEQNAGLFDEVLAAGGGYLSIRAPHQAALLASFFERNAVLAALCDVVVVVQSPFRSGARNAASAARKLGRPLCVVPSAPWEPKGRGCIAELRLGAIAIGGVRDVLELLRSRGALLLPAALRSGRVEVVTSGDLAACAVAFPEGPGTGPQRVQGAVSAGAKRTRVTKLRSAATGLREHSAQPMAEREPAPVPRPIEPDRSRFFMRGSNGDNATPLANAASGALSTSGPASVQLPLFRRGEDRSTDRAIVRAIQSGATSIDAIVEAAALSVGVVQAALLGLELDGAVVRDADCGYRLARQ